MNFNQAIIAGNLTDKPEEYKSQNGRTITNFSVATNRNWTDKNGEKQSKAEYHNCVAFGRTAENIIKYLSKGSSVLIKGRLQTRNWEDKNGNKKYKTEIVVENIEFINTNKEEKVKEENEEDFEVSDEDLDEIFD